MGPSNKQKLPRKAVLHASNVRAHFPLQAVRARKSFDLGIIDTKYGGLFHALNIVEGCGSFTVDFLNETNQKVWTFGRPPPRGRRVLCSKASVKENIKAYLEAIRELFCFFFKPYMYEEVLATMRVTAIVGAKTLCHTDAFRGCTDNYVLPHGVHFLLKVYRFPDFRCSVVTHRGSLYIPLSYNERSGLRMIGLDPHDPTKAIKYHFPNKDKELPGLVPYGKLNICIVGVVGGRLQYDTTDPFTSSDMTRIKSPNSLPTMEISEAFRIAGLPENQQELKPRCLKLGKCPDVWCPFPAWRWRYECIGKDPMCPHTHVYFRAFRETPTSENYTTWEGQPNFMHILED